MSSYSHKTRKPGSRKPAWMTRNLMTISWVSLLQDAASEMLYPIMPIFLNTVLGAPAAIVGAIEGAAEGAMALTKLVSKKINRFMPRKIMVLIGYAGAALGKFIIALAGIWQVVMLGRIVDRLGKGLRSAARDAILVQGIESKDRGKVIGFHRTGDTLGAVLGPALALALLGIFDNDIRSVLWISVIPAVLSTLLVLAIRDQDPQTRKSLRVSRETSASVQAADKANGTNHAKAAQLSAPIKRLIWVLAIFSLVNFPDALLLLHLSQDGFSVTAVVGLYLLFNISYASLSFPLGMLADRIRPQFVYGLGLVCFATTYLGLAFSSDKLLAFFLVIIYGGFAAANDVVGKSWVSKLAKDDQQLAVQARLQGLSGFGLLFAGIWAGLLWGLDGGLGIVPLIISGSLGLVAAAFVAGYRVR